MFHVNGLRVKCYYESEYRQAQYVNKLIFYIDMSNEDDLKTYSSKNKMVEDSSSQEKALEKKKWTKKKKESKQTSIAHANSFEQVKYEASFWSSRDQEAWAFNDQEIL